MISRRTVVTGLAFGAVLIALPAWAKPKSVLAMLDTDNDGTVDLAEAKKAASALFDKLDPDKDGTLTKDEYLAVVEQRFKAANPDNDGTLDARELRTKAGKALLRLLR